MAPSKKQTWAPSSKQAWAPSSKQVWAPSSKRAPFTSRTSAWNQDSKRLSGVQTTPPSPWKMTVTAPQYADILRERSLPKSLVGGQLERFRSNVLSVVEGLYRDRISPDLGEVQRRLRRSGWGVLDVQAVLSVCAREPDKYELVLPTADEPPRILLRSQPPGLHGWIDADMTADTYSPDVWAKFEAIFKELLREKTPDVRSTAGCEALALKLQRHLAHCNIFHKEFALGELLHIVKLSLNRPGCLSYDRCHGGRLQIIHASDSSCMGNYAEVAKVAEAVADPVAANHQVTIPMQTMSLPQKMCHAPTPVRARLTVEPGAPDPALKAIKSLRAAGPRLVNKRLSKPEQVQNEHATDDTHEIQKNNSNDLVSGASEGNNAACMDLAALGPEGVAECVLKILRGQPVPEELLREDAALQKFQAVLRHCVESLYRDCIVPTLVEIQQRLTKSGWRFSEVQGSLTLFARDPEQYRIELPGNGRPLCIFLRTPPAWFNGWRSTSADEGLCAHASSDWRSACLELEDSLKTQEVCLGDGSVLDGTIRGAAVELRQCALPQLQHLALGEVREVVKHLTEHGYLKYEGRHFRQI